VWDAYWALHWEIVKKMEDAQVEADKIRLMVMQRLS
jgi:hypothetical protein